MFPLATDIIPLWNLIDFAKHFYFGKGKPVRLEKIGHLQGIVDYYFYKIYKDNYNTYDRVNSQIIEQARKIKNGQFSYDFNNGYTELGDYLFVFGGGTISGSANGFVKQVGNQFIITAVIDYRYSDTFTDILSIREKITHLSSEPLEASILALLFTDFYGVFFDIIGSWQTKFYAAVNI